MSTQENKPKVSGSAAREELWRRGYLSWLLDENQQALYKLFHDKEFKIQTWLLARRSGKSFALCVLSVEQCLRHPGSIVKFLSPTKKQLERNIRPLMNQILTSCPEDIKPTLKAKDDIYYFPNGSELQMAGSEMGNIDALRGGFSNICVIDESQDVSNLPYAINSVLLPTTATTGGKILLAGTPPNSYDHEFLGYIEAGEQEGSLVRRTVYDNPRMPAKEIETQAQAMGGYQSDDFRREFLCEIIKDANRSVIPEFTEQKAKQLVMEWPRPVFYNPITSMDLGLLDFTVVLFGYYDFKKDKIVIEDEIVMKGSTMYLKTLGADILKTEENLWIEPTTREVIPVQNRVSDHNLVAINEIKVSTTYKVNFRPADKKEKMVRINFLRDLVNNDKIIINPRCKTLISHMLNAKWGKTKEIFMRCSQGSHYDAVDALSYLVKAVDYRHNPYPAGHGSDLRFQDAFYASENAKKKLLMHNKPIANPDVYKTILNMNKNPDKKERLLKAYDIMAGKVTEIKKKKGYFNNS